jgi:hypothetical protein
MVYNWLSKKSTRLTVACGKKIDLIVEDNQTKQGETTTIVCKFISQDHVSAIIGEVASSKSVEAAPICQASKIPQIATGLFYRRLSSGGHRPVCPRKITAQECRVYDGCEAGLQRRIGGKALEGAFFSNHFSVEDKSPLCSGFRPKIQTEIQCHPGRFGWSWLRRREALGRCDHPSRFDRLRKTSGCDSGYREFSWSFGQDHRNAKKSAVIITIKDGAYKYAETIRAEELRGSPSCTPKNASLFKKAGLRSGFSLPIQYTVPCKCPSEPPIHVEVNRPICNRYCSQSCL